MLQSSPTQLTLFGVVCDIEHDMHVVFSLADRITVLAQGTPLVEDTPENIKGNPKVREAYLGEAQV